MKIYCPQCQPLAIQGIACHEMGCPLAQRPWVSYDDRETVEPLRDEDISIPLCDLDESEDFELVQV